MMILVVGASGIVGQHLRLCQPRGETVVYTARDPALPHDFPLKLTAREDVAILLDRWIPDVVINLAGENRPDVVERDPAATAFINQEAPVLMAAWCLERGKRLIHVSTQGVFGGGRAPYEPETVHPEDQPVNAYGRQKALAELGVLDRGGLVARLTFILGIRPFPHVGRANPLEQMLTMGVGQKQVDDRLFSPCFARDAAVELWDLVTTPHDAPTIVHIGVPVSTTRADIAEAVLKYTNESALNLQRVRHDEAFPAPTWAPRPFDTTFAASARHRLEWDDGLTEAIHTWRTLLDYMDAGDRAVEIGTFLGMPAEEALTRLRLGFGPLHNAVAEDFRNRRPGTDEELLEWYRQTAAYIWELSAYHLDTGFNYLGMCDGIVNHLIVRNRRHVLCLGDGIGDLTMKCYDGGLRPVYHDLYGSKTADFAAFRMKRRYGKYLDMTLTSGWEPTFVSGVEAVIALDFFEHLTDVERWAMGVFNALRPSGLFLAQNAFGIGDDEHEGSIPMHLTRNNKYVQDWEPMLRVIGFEQEAGGWWRKP